MRRTLFVFALLLIPAAVLAAPTVYDQVWGDRVEERLCAVESEVGIESPECVPPTTTTSSTTTTQPTTTTTQPPTTTSQPPTGLTISATQPYPGGLKDGEGFSFEIACINNSSVECDLNEQGKLAIASFEYFGHGMPYLYSDAVDGEHNHAWWVDGDREGYRCAYGFLYDEHPNPFGSLDQSRPAEFIARATIVRPVGYGKVNDTFMEEAERYYDGTPTPYFGTNLKEIPEEDCQQTALEPDFDYDAYVAHGPDDIRVGLFRSDGEIGDIRDFTAIDVRVPGHFEFIGFEDGRVSIVFVLGASNKVSHVFYYDVFNSGRIVVEVNGTTIGE